MQLDPSATVWLLLVNLVATAARSLHQWVSSRESDSVNLEQLKRMIDEANERASDRHGDIQRQMLNFEQNMIEVQTILGVSGRGKHHGAGA